MNLFQSSPNVLPVCAWTAQCVLAFVCVT